MELAGCGRGLGRRARRGRGSVGPLDRAFAPNPEEACGERLLLAEAIIALAHGVGLEVVAEGVETEEQLALLRRCECDLVQGYLVGHPVTGDELLERLARKLSAAS